MSKSVFLVTIFNVISAVRLYGLPRDCCDLGQFVVITNNSKMCWNPTSEEITRTHLNNCLGSIILVNKINIIENTQAIIDVDNIEVEIGTNR